MADLASSLKVVLPLALDAEAFAAPENQDTLATAIADLRGTAHALETHGRPRDAGFAVLSRILGLEARELDRSFREGRREDARGLVTAMVDTCVACHSRLPASAASSLGRSLYDAVPAESLAPQERLRLELATRQFDRALRGIESLLADPEVAPAAIDSGGFLDAYLRVGLRVAEDPERLARRLSAWRDRSELPPYLADLIETWTRTLRDMPGLRTRGGEIERARQASDEAGRLRRFPADRRPRVQEFQVSALLNRALVENTLDAAARAEAYYLLGLVELHIATVDWLASPSAHLEAAIRVDPGSHFAREAYLLLEEIVVAGAAASGEAVPISVEHRMGELRGLAGFAAGAKRSTGRTSGTDPAYP